MKKYLAIPITILGLAAALPCQAEVYTLPDFTRAAGEALVAQHFDFVTNDGWSGTPPNEILNETSVYLKFTVSWEAAANIGTFLARFNVNDDGGAGRIGTGTEGSGFALINGNAAGDGDGAGPATVKPTVDAVDKNVVTSTTFVIKVDQTKPTPGGDWWFGNTAQQAGAGHFVYINPDLGVNEALQSTKWAAWRSGQNGYEGLTFQTDTADVALNFTGIALYTGTDTPFSTAVAGVDAATSTVTASPTSVPANGITTSTVTVSLKDVNNVPLSGKLVSLANTAGPGTPNIDPASATTNFFGVATFTVNSSTVGSEQFTATGDSVVITQTASVDFVSAVTDAGNSTVVASPVTIPADGTTESFVTVTLRNSVGQPLPGKLVSLANTAGPGTPTISPAASGSDTTDANGVATFRVKSTTIGTEEFTATCNTDTVTLAADAVSVDFVAPGLAALLVYEGFDYELGVLTGKNGGTGFSAGWASPEANFVASVYDQTGSGFTEWDNVFASGGVTISSPPRYIATLFPQANPQSTATRALTSDAGTLAGADNVLWMSAVFHYEKAQGSAFLNLGLTSGGYITDRGRILSNAGMNFMGVSNWAQPLNNWNTRLNATIVENHTTGTGYQAPYVQALGSVNPAETDMFVVLKFTFGTSDRVEAAFFTEIESISEAAFYTHPTYVSAIYAGDIDESGLNTISYNQQIGDNAIDEIRLGSTFNDLIGLASITSFEAAGAEGVINQSAKTISLTVPFGTNLATLAPTFTLSSGTSNQTSGAPPFPTFAVQNPATYTVTDVSTDPDTVNNYTVTVTVAPQVIPTTTLVIDLGTSPAGTTIEGSTFIGSGPTNLPLPVLPAGSILRSIAVNAKLEVTDNDNFASDLAVLLDPTPGAPGGDFSVGISNGVEKFGATLQLGWPASANAGAGTSLVDTKIDATWAGAGAIDLSTTGLFLGNAYGGPTVGGTWSGTITLTYDLVGAGSDYDTWSGGAAADIDSNGDGVYNGVAWALNAPDPNANAIGLLPILDNTSDPTYVIFKFNRSDLANDDANTTIAVEYGNDLDGWTTAVDDNDNVDIIVNPGSPTDEVIVKLKRSTLAAGGRIFARLNVVVTTP
jgi:hypothetical protein